jgi:hypothetical protein
LRRASGLKLNSRWRVVGGGMLTSAVLILLVFPIL